MEKDMNEILCLGMEMGNGKWGRKDVGRGESPTPLKWKGVIAC